MEQFIPEIAVLSDEEKLTVEIEVKIRGVFAKKR